jgi:hypothetical protein
MNEPKRWIEEGPPQAVERLLQAAAAEQPSDGSLKRVLAGVGVGLGATGAAATGTAATAVAGAAAATGKGVIVVGAWTKWVVLSVAAVGAGTVAVQRASVSADEPRAVVTAAAPVRKAPAVTAAPQPVVSATVAPAPEPAVAETPVAPKPKAALAPSKPAAVPEAEAPIDAEKLAQEVRAVDRARSALAAGRPAETLSALDDYERTGGRRFAPEALYLRMQALLSLGRKVEARSTAERLVRSFPQSPHTARARRVMETIQ